MLKIIYNYLFEHDHKYEVLSRIFIDLDKSHVYIKCKCGAWNEYYQEGNGQIIFIYGD